MTRTILATGQSAAAFASEVFSQTLEQLSKSTMRLLPRSSFFALAVLLVFGAGPVDAQSVTAPAAAANCIENALLGEFACASGATATGTDATAIGGNSSATGL